MKFELTDVQRYYLLGHLDGDPKELAKVLDMKPLQVKKFIAANTPKVEKVDNTANPPLSAETPVVTPPQFKPALDLMGRTTGEGKQRGVAIMTGGAAMAGDDARKAIRNNEGDQDDSSYVFRFKVNAPVNGPTKL